MREQRANLSRTQEKSAWIEKDEDPLGLGRPIRALVVDDDDDTRDMFGLLLGSLGWRVTAACSGIDALERFDPAATDLLLTDLEMPEMDGYELLALMRARSSQRLVAIAVTGYDEQDEGYRMACAGFDGHLTKPFQLASLLDLLRELGERQREDLAPQARGLLLTGR
jgi:CheY-like chemotaxis protein